MKHLAAFFIITLLLISCKKEVENYTPTNAEKLYTPYVTGYWIEYLVDSTVYTYQPPVIKTDSSAFYLRYEFDSLFVMSSGDTALRLKILRKNHLADVYEAVRIAYVINNAQGLETVIDDLSIINLRYPVESRNQWKGYARADSTLSMEVTASSTFLKDWIFKYTMIDSTYRLQTGTAYPGTSVITHIHEKELYHYFHSHQVFLKNVGMIEDVRFAYGRQDPTRILDENWTEIEEGFRLRYTMVDYKK